MNKRFKICEEGTETFPLEYIIPGAVRFPEGQDEVPVTIQFDHFNVIGKARNLEREENGDVTVEVEFFDKERGEEIGAILGGAVYMNELSMHMFRGYRFFERGTLREVGFTIDVPWAPGQKDLYPGFPGIPTNLSEGVSDGE